MHRLSQRVTNARGAPTPARFARLNALHLPTGPTPQRVPPVTTGHKRPQGPSPSAFRPSQRVTNSHGALAPAHSARLNASHTPTGPQPQKIPPVLTGQICPRGPSPKAFCSAQRHKMPTGPSPQWTPPVTTGHTCPRGPRSSAFHPSQRATDAHGALAPAWRLADLPTCRVDFPTCRPADLAACRRVRVVLRQDGFCMDFVAFPKT